MPSLTQLDYILAVDKHRHFGKAADQCHVTQPTLSMQIQKVEEEIGFPVFDRNKKPVIPTEKGAKFINQAKVLIREHRKLMDISKQEGGEVSGGLRLGVIPTIAPYLIPLFIQDFSKTYPKIQLSIDEIKTDTMIKMLNDDTLDVGLMATPLGDSRLHEQPIFYEPFYLYVSKSDPLNSRKRIKEDDLKGDDMWLLEDGHCFRSQIVRYCSLKKRDGVFPNVLFEGGNLDTLRHLIRKSQGYTLVPALFVENLDAQERSGFVREFEKPVPTREVSLVYRRDQWKTDILDALQTSIKKNLPKGLTHLDPKKQEVLSVG